MRVSATKKMCEKAKTDVVCRPKSQLGFSLVEMIVAMVIFLIVTGAIYGLLQAGRIDRNRSSRRTDIMKNARAAIYLIGRDALNAGLSFHRNGAVVPDDFISNTLGFPVDADTERDRLTSVMAGNNLFQNNLNEDPNVRTDMVAFAYRDMNFNVGNTVSLTGVVAGNQPDTARVFAETPQATVSNTYDLFLIESDSSQVAVMATSVSNFSIDFAPTDPLNLNQSFNGNGVNGSLLRQCTPPTLTENCTTYLASAKRFIWVSYKVKRDGTLVRTSYGNNAGQPSDQQIQELPLAYNIKDLQFRYVLRDGRITENPIVGPDGIVGTLDDRPDDFNLIRQITVTLKVASTERDEQTGEFAVITLNATFSLRNIEYDVG